MRPQCCFRKITRLIQRHSRFVRFFSRFKNYLRHTSSFSAKFNYSNQIGSLKTDCLLCHFLICAVFSKCVCKNCYTSRLCFSTETTWKQAVKTSAPLFRASWAKAHRIGSMLWLNLLPMRSLRSIPGSHNSQQFWFSLKRIFGGASQLWDLHF